MNRRFPVKAFATALLVVFLFPAYGQSFAKMIGRMHAMPESQRQAVADSFMAAAGKLPYTDSDTTVHFVYNQPATTLALAGDATGWSPSIPFLSMPGTTFRYLSLVYEPDARLDYKFVVNGSQWILDPGNPYTCMGGYGPNSELRMPGYSVPPETSFYGNIPHGTLIDTVFASAILGNSRQVKIYLPDGYPGGKESYPVILFHDGTDYLSLGQTVNILDYLTANRLITPVIALFVPPVDRTPEYSGSKIDAFTSFIATELMPVIDARYKTSRDPARRAMAGASNGGNIALYIGMRHPELFGRIAAQSSNVIPVISQTFLNGPKLDLGFYLDMGKYDIPVLIPLARGLRDILQARQYSLQYSEWPEGHSWGNWKGHLKNALTLFFPLSSGMNDQHPGKGYRLMQNNPNPFHDRTTLRFFAPAGKEVELRLFDLGGKSLGSVYNGIAGTGQQEVDYRHRQGAGHFILTLGSPGVPGSSILITSQ